MLPSEFCRAPVAQLDRAPGYEPGGREFESLRARQFLSHSLHTQIGRQLTLEWIGTGSRVNNAALMRCEYSRGFSRGAGIAHIYRSVRWKGMRIDLVAKLGTQPDISIDIACDAGERGEMATVPSAIRVGLQ
jgi:hypothetical protein